MDPVTFEEENLAHRTRRLASPKANAGGITGLLLTLGFAKNESQAVILEIILLILVAGGAAYVYFFGGPHAGKITPAEQSREIQWMREGHTGVPPESYMTGTK